MKTEDMLCKMYKQGLSAAEMKAIGKNRSFTKDELSSPILFETVFLSKKGLVPSLHSLDEKEIALLHILKFINNDVDVSFFEPIYGDMEMIGKWRFYDSFSQRYREVLKGVRKSLVRKGILIFAEEEYLWSNTTKMEMLKFRFPEEFHDLLPSPFPSKGGFVKPARAKDEMARKRIMHVLDPEGPDISGGSKRFDIRIKDGKLVIDEKRFQDKRIRTWQLESWKRDTMPNLKNIETIGSPFDVLRYAFSILGDNEWIRPEDLSVFWDVLYPNPKDRWPDNNKICEGGWKWGCLAKCEVKGKTYYRPTEIEKEGVIKPERYILMEKDGTMSIDLNLIPFKDLEAMADISIVEVRDSKLAVSPDLIGIGKHYTDIRRHSLILWLEKNSGSFCKTLKDVDDRWGKCIIHKDIMIARVTDLSLKVKLLHTFRDQIGIIPLEGDYIAFPECLSHDIRKSVERAGYVVKIEKDHDDKTQGGG